MKLSELLAMLRDKAKDIEVSADTFLAVNLRMIDVEESDIDNDDQKKEPGVFYVEVKNGNIDIQPYRYNDTNCTILMKMPHFIKMIDGKLDAVAAFTVGKLKIDGDIGKAIAFSEIIKTAK